MQVLKGKEYNVVVGGLCFIALVLIILGVSIVGGL